jgi:hypothetical protein
MDHYLPPIPADLDVTQGIPREVVGLREGLTIALANYQDACSQAEQDPELREINDQCYVAKKVGERKGIAAAMAEREVQRLEKLINGHESDIAKDEAAVTLGKPDPATQAAVIQSFTALSRDERLAVLRSVENDLFVPTCAREAREYLQAILQANPYLSLVPDLHVNGQSTRMRLEASLKASFNPDGYKRIAEARTALKVARESAARVRELLAGDTDIRARLIRS